MYARKVDGNTPEILDALHSIGWSWIDTHRLGRGFPDGLTVRHEMWGAWRIILVEVKRPGEKLTGDETFFHHQYPGLVHVWRTAEDAIKDCRGENENPN